MLCDHWSFKKKFLLGYSWYNIMLVSAVQQSESVIHIHISTLFFRFLSHIGHYRVLSNTVQYSSSGLACITLWFFAQLKVQWWQMLFLLCSQSLFPGTSTVSAIQLVPNTCLWNGFMSQHINGNRTVSKNFPSNHGEHLWNILAYNRKASLDQEALSAWFQALFPGWWWALSNKPGHKGLPRRFIADQLSLLARLLQASSCR